MFPFPTRSFSNALPIRSNWSSPSLTSISVIQLCWYLFLKQVLSLFCSVTPCYCRYAGAQNCPPCWWRRRKQPDRHWADSLKNRCTSPPSPFCPKYSTLNTPQPPPYPSCQTKHQTASKKCDFEDQYWGELKLIVATTSLRRWWQQNADIMIVKMLKKMRVVALSPAYHPPPFPRRNITPFADKPP